VFPGSGQVLDLRAESIDSLWESVPHVYLVFGSADTGKLPDPRITRHGSLNRAGHQRLQSGVMMRLF
jgi:hypothetical protein